MVAVDPSPHCSMPSHVAELDGEHEPPSLTALGGGQMGCGGSVQSVTEHTKCAPSQVHVSLSWMGPGHTGCVVAGHSRFLIEHVPPRCAFAHSFAHWGAPSCGQTHLEPSH